MGILIQTCACVCLQSKALIPLQTEAHPETKQKVLTNYMFPQQPRHDEGTNCVCLCVYVCVCVCLITCSLRTFKEANQVR